MYSSASESDTSFSGKAGGRPKRSLRTKTLSWSDHVDKITYASDGESLLVEDRVSEKKPLAEENDKNKKGANVKRLQGTPMEGFQIMTLDDLNSVVSDKQALVQGDDSDSFEEEHSGGDILPTRVEESSIINEVPVGAQTPVTSSTNKETDKHEIVRKRPVPAPRSTKSTIASKNETSSGTNTAPVNNNNTYNQKKIPPPVASKPEIGVNDRGSKIVSEVVAHGDQSEKVGLPHCDSKDRQVHHEDAHGQRSPPTDTGSSHVLPKPQVSRTSGSQQNNLNTTENPDDSDRVQIKEPTVKTEAQSEPRVYYAAKPVPKVNKNSIETNIDEITPLMSETTESGSSVPQVPNMESVPLHQQDPSMLMMPQNQFMPMRGPYPMPVRGGPMPRFPMQPLFPQHFHPPPNMQSPPMGPFPPQGDMQRPPMGPFPPQGVMQRPPMGPYPPYAYMQRPPMGPFHPRFMPPNFRAASPDHQGSYSLQNDSQDSANLSMQEHPAGMPPMSVNGEPANNPQLNFSTGSSPVPGDVEPRYFTFEGREYPEGHPMLYPHYGMGAPSTMTGITGYSVAPSMPAIGPSVMQDANPHLTLSIVLLVLGNWIMGMQI